MNTEGLKTEQPPVNKFFVPAVVVRQSDVLETVMGGGWWKGEGWGGGVGGSDGGDEDVNKHKCRQSVFLWRSIFRPNKKGLFPREGQHKFGD